MNDEEIMKQFNETFSDDKIAEQKQEQIPVTPYRATTNQNTIPTNLSNTTLSNNNIPPLNNNINNQNMQAKMMNVENTNYTTYESQKNYAPNVNYNYVPFHIIVKRKRRYLLRCRQNLFLL